MLGGESSLRKIVRGFEGKANKLVLDVVENRESMEGLREGDIVRAL